MAVRKTTKLIVVHVTATKPSTPAGVAEVTKMHKARGFSTIGYHYIVRRNGKVEKGRPENQIGAHVQGWNSQSLGISLEGGLDEFTGKPVDTRTPAQTEALIDLIRDILKRYPDAKVCGHRDLSPDRDKDGVIEPWEYVKACPCFDAIPWATQNGLPAASIFGPWTVVSTDTGGKISTKAPDRPDVENQKLLKRAGFEFGPIDGVTGPKTRAAIARFQKQAGLPVTQKFDPETVQKLKNIAIAPVVAAIEADDTLKKIPPPINASIDTLRERGSRTIAIADQGQIVAATGVVTGVLTTVQTVRETGSKVLDTVQSMQDLLGRAAELWPGLLVIVIGAVLFYLFQRHKQVRLDEHNTGANINRREAVEFIALRNSDLTVE